MPRSGAAEPTSRPSAEVLAGTGPVIGALIDSGSQEAWPETKQPPGLVFWAKSAENLASLQDQC